MNIQYNFRIGPEAIWLVVNTVLGTLLVEAIAFFANLSTLPGADDVRTWVATLAVALVRTGLGALLAVVTGGGFQKPGEPGPAPTPPAPGT